MWSIGGLILIVAMGFISYYLHNTFFLKALTLEDDAVSLVPKILIKTIAFSRRVSYL